MGPKPQPKGGNCRDKNTCRLENKCLTPKIIYQADVTNDTDDTYKYYLHERCLNKKSEFISKWRHQNKLLLKNVKASMD